MNKNILQIKYLIKKSLLKFANQFSIFQEEYKQLEEFCVTQLLKISKNLRAKLKIDETGYRYIANIGHSDGRSFYLYSVVSEVMKVAIVNMRMLDFIADSEEDDKYKLKKESKKSKTNKDEKEWIERVIFEGFIDEQNLWRRKLSECLCDLICFSECNEPLYFKLFIAISELSSILYANKDFQEFFNCEIGNLNEQAKSILEIAKSTVNSVDRKKCWFLTKQESFENMPKSPDFLVSYRQRFLKAIELANEGERAVLGFTYQVGYGGVSQSIHFGVRGPSFNSLDYDSLKSGVNIISMLSYHILRRAYNINATKPPSRVAENIFNEIAKGKGASQLHFLSAVRDHDIGDLVIVSGNDLSEILDIRTSKYGYKSYYVKYLVNPPLESVKEEWLPARYIYKRIMRKSKAREYFEGRLKKDPKRRKEIELILQMPDDKIFESIKSVFIDLAKHGILQQELVKPAKRKNLNKY